MFSFKKTKKSIKSKKSICKTSNKYNNKDQFNKIKYILEKVRKRHTPTRIKIKNPSTIKNDKYYSFHDIINASVGQNYLNSSNITFNKYKQWLKIQGIHDKNYPTFEYIIETKNISQLHRTLMDWAIFEFNDTKNIGNTIKKKCSEILLQLNHYNIHLTLDFLPGINRICKGMNKIANKHWGKMINKPKRALLRPMIRKILKSCLNNQDRLRILFPFEFMLRSEHYVWNNDLKNKPYLQIGNLQFGQLNPLTGRPDTLTIHMGKDKNHQFERDLQRTTYCKCHTKWADLCVVCLSWRTLRTYIWHQQQSQPVITDSNGKHVTYNSQLKFIKAWTKTLGLDPDEYGTHSLRAGGATEAFLSGHTALEIQQYGEWECLGSVLRYIRPKNPDLQYFKHSCSTYEKLRREQELTLARTNDKRDWMTKERLRFNLELEKERKKQNHGQRSNASKYFYIYIPNKGRPYTLNIDDIFKDAEAYL